MASQKIEELTKDLTELDSLLKHVTRQRNIDLIEIQKKRIETELVHLRQQQTAEQEAAKSNDLTGVAQASIPTESKRYECEISNYAWDQNDKFIKLFVPLDGVQDAGESKVTATFTNNTILLKASDVRNKDYKFFINNLLHGIDTEKSYRKIKTNAVTIFAKKAEEKKTWTHLTSTEKRLDDLKKHAMDVDDKETSKDDPGSSLMNIMKKMYEGGDPEMKRMIAKAWTESQEKKVNSQSGPDIDL